MFRRKYDQIRKMDELDIDFSMNLSEFEPDVAPWIAIMFSKTIIIFHGAVVGSILIVKMLIFVFLAQHGRDDNGQESVL